MEQDQLNLWICMIALERIKAMRRNLELYMDRLNAGEKNERPGLVTTYNNRLVNRHNDLHEILKQMKGEVETEDEDDEVRKITPEDLKSRTYTILASYLKFVLKPEEALDYANNSFELFSNQNAKYLIAVCLEDSKLEIGALSGGKKKGSPGRERSESSCRVYRNN